MASTDTAITTAAGTGLQEAATRHLWMHFTRMGSYDSVNHVPIIARGDGAYVYDENGKQYLDGVEIVHQPPLPRAASRIWRDYCVPNATEAA